APACPPAGFVASEGVRFFFHAGDSIRDFHVTGVQTCALPISVVAGQIVRLRRIEMLDQPWEPLYGRINPLFQTPALLPENSESLTESLAILQHLAARGWVFARADRKSTRLNSSHVKISYAVFCLKTLRRPQ